MKNIIKMISFCLVLVLCMGLFSGCGKKDTESKIVDSAMSDDDEDIFFNVEDGDSDGTSNNTKNGKTENGSTSNGSTSSAKFFDSIPKELKGTEVVFAVWDDDGYTAYRKLAEVFTKKSGIKVKFVTYNQTEYVSTIISQTEGGVSGPDVLVCVDSFPYIAQALQPLPSCFNINDGFWDKRLSEETKLNGKYYLAAPYDTIFNQGSFVIYNKRVFNAAGVTTPDEYYKQNKWTWENFFKISEELKVAGYTGALNDYSRLSGQFGKNVIQYDSKSAKFSFSANDSEFLDILKTIRTQAKKGTILEIMKSENFKAFESGKIGMVCTNSYDIKKNGRLSEMDASDMAAVQLPTSYKGKNAQYLPLTIRGYGIARNAKNPEAAYYFLRFFLDAQNYKTYNIPIFANKVVEKFFYETYLPIYRNANLYYDVASNPMILSGGAKNFFPDKDTWKEYNNAEANQLETVLSKFYGVIKAGVDAGNKKISEIK